MTPLSCFVSQRGGSVAIETQIWRDEQAKPAAVRTERQLDLEKALDALKKNTRPPNPKAA